MHYLGIDIGSLFCEVVPIDGSDIVASIGVPTGDTVGALGAAMIAKEKISSKRQTAVV